VSDVPHVDRRAILDPAPHDCYKQRIYNDPSWGACQRVAIRRHPGRSLFRVLRRNVQNSKSRSRMNLTAVLSTDYVPRGCVTLEPVLAGHERVG